MHLRCQSEPLCPACAQQPPLSILCRVSASRRCAALQRRASAIEQRQAVRQVHASRLASCSSDTGMCPWPRLHSGCLSIGCFTTPTSKAHLQRHPSAVAQGQAVHQEDTIAASQLQQRHWRVWLAALVRLPLSV